MSNILADERAAPQPDWDVESIYASHDGFWSYDEDRQEWVHCKTPLDVFVT